MKNIEKALISYVNGKGPKVSYRFLCASATEKPKELIDIHFKLIAQELDSLYKTQSVEKAIVLLDNLNVMIANCDSINRNIIKRGILKLNERINHITIEEKKKLIKTVSDYGQLAKKFQQIRVSLDSVEEQTENTESKPFEFVKFLVDIIKDTDYVEYTFEKMPQLVNAKDKNGVPLFRFVINRFIENIYESDEENIFYYGNIISLLTLHKRFNLSDNDKHKVLDDIYKSINKISITKKSHKQNKDKIEWLNNIVNTVKGINDNQSVTTIAAKYRVPVFFDEFIKIEAQMAKAPSDYESDRYYIGDYIISIDDASAAVIDDALSCTKLENGNYLLGVHIPSVLSYFDYETDIVQEALNRIQAIYLDKKYQTIENEYRKVVPILPFSFSAGTGSLLPGSLKYTKSFYFEIDKEGIIVNEKFLNTIIKNDKKTSYHEVNKILKNGTDNEPLQNTITALNEVSNIIDNVYKLKPLYENIEGNSRNNPDCYVKRTGAEKMVYLIMLLTGNRVAEYFSKNGYPCLYRTHDVIESDNKKLEAMVENLTKTYVGYQYEKLYQLLSEICPPGRYDMEGAHYGLGLEHYCHCTSTLRRAPDIIVEHALDICYDKNPSDRDLARLEDEIKKQLFHINSRQDPIEWFAKDFSRSYQKRR